MTAGLGLCAKDTLHLDISGAVSTGTVEYDGNDIPTEIQLAFNLSFDF